MGDREVDDAIHNAMIQYPRRTGDHKVCCGCMGSDDGATCNGNTSVPFKADGTFESASYMISNPQKNPLPGWKIDEILNLGSIVVDWRYVLDDPDPFRRTSRGYNPPPGVYSVAGEKNTPMLQQVSFVAATDVALQTALTRLVRYNNDNLAPIDNKKERRVVCASGIRRCVPSLNMPYDVVGLSAESIGYFVGKRAVNIPAYCKDTGYTTIRCVRSTESPHGFCFVEVTGDGDLFILLDLIDTANAARRDNKL
jgi:hypothetical protein